MQDLEEFMVFFEQAGVFNEDELEEYAEVQQTLLLFQHAVAAFKTLYQVLQ